MIKHIFGAGGYSRLGWVVQKKTVRLHSCSLPTGRTSLTSAIRLKYQTTGVLNRLDLSDLPGVPKKTFLSASHRTPQATFRSHTPVDVCFQVLLPSFPMGWLSEVYSRLHDSPGRCVLSSPRHIVQHREKTEDISLVAQLPETCDEEERRDCDWRRDAERLRRAALCIVLGPSCAIPKVL